MLQHLAEGLGDMVAEALTIDDLIAWRAQRAEEGAGPYTPRLPVAPGCVAQNSAPAISAKNHGNRGINAEQIYPERLPAQPPAWLASVSPATDGV